MNNTFSINDYLNAWNSTDVDNLMSFFADDVVYKDVALDKTMNKAQLAEFVAEMHQNYETVAFELLTICQGENNVSWEWRMFGSKKDGEKIDILGQSMTELVNGKITRNRDYWSTMPPARPKH